MVLGPLVGAGLAAGSGDGEQHMEVRVLGPVTVVADDGREHVLGVTREAALLADLVVHAGEVMSAGRLIDDLWRGTPTAGAGATLQTYVKNLRRLLELASSAAAVCVVRTVRPGYVVELHPDAVDALRAERMIAEGRRAVYSGDAAEGVRQLSGAIALWRGPRGLRPGRRWRSGCSPVTPPTRPRSWRPSRSCGSGSGSAG
jgi:DNA-binding SARP family transcriptional activator